MGAIIKKELKMMMREKGNIFFLLIMPILFIVMFGSIFGKADNMSLTIHYIDKDQSASSAAFMKQLDHIKGVTLKKEKPSALNDMVDQIKKGQLSFALVVNKGFEEALHSGKQANVKLYQDPTASEGDTIEAILKNISNGYQQLKLTQTLSSMGQTQDQITQTLAPSVQIEKVKTQVKSINYITQVVPGMTVMFVFYIMISMTRRFFKEKDSGLLARCQSTAMKPLQYLIGMWIPYALAVLIQCAVLLGFGHFVYHLQLGDIKATGLLIIGLSLCGSGIGLALSVLVRGENQGMAITQIVALGGAMVGGLWMPSYLMPSFIQKIGQFTPQYWAQKGLQDIFAHGAGINGIWLSLLILVVFGVAGLLVAVLRLPHFMKSAAN
ncbi:MAG: ABC transporter permease [Tuberibacillus sp.]